MDRAEKEVQAGCTCKGWLENPGPVTDVVPEYPVPNHGDYHRWWCIRDPVWYGEFAYYAILFCPWCGGKLVQPWEATS